MARPLVGGSSVVSMCTVVDLPAPFGPEEAVDLAGSDLEIDPVDGADAALEDADEPLDLDPVRACRPPSRSTYRFPQSFLRSRYPGRVVLRSVCICLLALAIAPAACGRARGQVLAPGIGYEKQLEFTRHGPIVLHVLTAPKPGGLYTPRAGALERRHPRPRDDQPDAAAAVAARRPPPGSTATSPTPAGVPNGTFLQDGVYKSEPNPGPLLDRDRRARQSRRAARRAALDLAGLEPAARARRHQPAARPERRHDLHARRGAAVTPPATGTIESIVVPFPALTAGGELRGQVVQVNSSGGGTPIPANGAVLVARGGMAAAARPGGRARA